MKIAVAGDSAGEGLARQLAEHLKERFTVAEVSRPVGDATGGPTGGPTGGLTGGNDEFYANLSDRVATDVVNGVYDRAILVCGTGIGVSIAANKVPGIRAALCHDTYSAERASLSNNAQIITMGARVVGNELAKSIADAFLEKSFDVNGRSAGNVRAIDEVDAKYNK